MAYTASINDLTVEVFKDGVLYDRVGPWGDVESAQNFIDTRLRTYAEADIARENGTALVESFKEIIAQRLAEKDWSIKDITDLLAE